MPNVVILVYQLQYRFNPSRRCALKESHMFVSRIWSIRTIYLLHFNALNVDFVYSSTTFTMNMYNKYRQI